MGCPYDVPQLLHDRRSPQHLQQGRHGQQEHTPGLQAKYFNLPVGEVGGEEGVGHDAGGRGCSSTTQVRPARTQLITQVAGIATLGGIRPRAQRGHTPLRAIGKGTQQVSASKRALRAEPRTCDSDHGRCLVRQLHTAEHWKFPPCLRDFIHPPVRRKNWLGSKLSHFPALPPFLGVKPPPNSLPSGFKYGRFHCTGVEWVGEFWGGVVHPRAVVRSALVPASSRAAGLNVPRK